MVQEPSEWEEDPNLRIQNLHPQLRSSIESIDRRFVRDRVVWFWINRMSSSKDELERTEIAQQWVSVVKQESQEVAEVVEPLIQEIVNEQTTEKTRRERLMEILTILQAVGLVH